MRAQPVPHGTTRPDELREDLANSSRYIGTSGWTGLSWQWGLKQPVRGNGTSLTNEMACVRDIPPETRPVATSRTEAECRSRASGVEP